MKYLESETSAEIVNTTSDQSDDDEDVCDNSEINRLFPESKQWNEHKVSEEPNYLLHLAATQDNEPNIAVSLANYKTHVFTLGNSGLAELTKLEEHTNTIVDVKFVPNDKNLLYTGSCDGSIRLWDIRTPKKSIGLFTDTSVELEKEQKVFTCFDVSNNNKVLCAGTEIFETDAFILFWDVRNTKLLGGYWESHTEDITQLKFHHTNPDRLISGSTDGLINLYDLTQVAEEDALVDCLNTESSVETLEWFDNGGKDGVSCITHIADVQLWDIDGVQPHTHLRREDIAKAMKKGTEDFVYVVGTHETNHGLLLLAGSNAHQGQCFRGFSVKKNLIPAAGFTQNKQRVRASWYNKNTGLLLTGGEMGILNTCILNLKNTS